MDWPIGLPVFAIGAAVLMSAAALANHPGEGLDAAMVERERYFEAIDRPVPRFMLQDTEGIYLSPREFEGKVVVVQFIYTHCPDVCPLHTDRLVEIQQLVGQSAMTDLVRFVSITTDPSRDTSDVLQNYADAHGIDQANWTLLRPQSDQAEDTTRTLAEAFGHRFTMGEHGMQMHGVVTHIIDRQGRWRANFHGLEFATVNMVQYINQLTNEHGGQGQHEPSGFWGRLLDFFGLGENR
tara:strand:- start:1358 stop:2071 length:714 start_codon:yes stop_codon:yes gene_type:complete